jgi:hypothetical protein
MPEPFESNVFDSARTSLMKSALEVAMLKCKPSRADENQTRTLLASAIIELIKPSRRMRSLRTYPSRLRELIRRTPVESTVALAPLYAASRNGRRS